MSGLLRKMVGLGKWRKPKGLHFEGDYRCWKDAVDNAQGYDSPAILEKTRASILQVRDGKAAYERDSVLFDQVEHSFPVLAGLLRAALASDGRLCVVDFGGSLGSSYFQCRQFLQPTRKLEWLVVEQPAHVACGKRDLESDQLHFYETIEQCRTNHDPNVLLASSVLQYLPAPYETLNHLLQRKIQHFIIDRTAFHHGDRDRLTVQTVPEWIYPASYPAWFFNEERFLAAITSNQYRLVAEFDGTDQVALPDGQPYFKGYIFELEDVK